LNDCHACAVDFRGYVVESVAGAMGNPVAGKPVATLYQYRAGNGRDDHGDGQRHVYYASSDTQDPYLHDIDGGVSTEVSGKACLWCDALQATVCDGGRSLLLPLFYLYGRR
jgi:hypothetical protein